MRSSGRSTITHKEGIAGTTCDRGPGLAGGLRDGEHGLARIVLVDDQCDVLTRLRDLIKQNSDLVVVAACRCADGAMLAVQQYRPAVVVLGVRPPARGGGLLLRGCFAGFWAEGVCVTTTPLTARDHH